LALIIGGYLDSGFIAPGSLEDRQFEATTFDYLKHDRLLNATATTELPIIFAHHENKHLWDHFGTGRVIMTIVLGILIAI
jgi:hypothetical protein